MSLQNTTTKREQVYFESSMYCVDQTENLAGGRRVYGAKSVQLAPGETKEVELFTVNQPFERLRKGGGLRLVHLSRGWDFVVPAVPSRSKLFVPKPPAPQLFEVEILFQEWEGMRGGTRIADRKGREGKIKGDVAGINMDVRIRNRTKELQHFRAPVFLVGADGQLLRPIRPSAEKGTGPSRLPKKGLPLQPGEAVELTLHSGMTGIDKLRKAGKLFIRHPSGGWKLPLSSLPADAELFGK